MSEIDRMWFSLIKVAENCLKQLFDSISDDPMMECFKESQETKNFMFSRINEIVKENIALITDETNKTLLKKLKELEHSYSKTQGELSSLQQIHSKISETAMIASKEEFNQLKKEVEELTSKSQMMGSELQNLRNQNSVLLEEKENSHISINSLKEKLDKSNQDTARKKEELKSLLDKFEKLKSRFASIENERASLKQDEDSKTSEHQRMSNELNRLRFDNQELLDAQSRLIHKYESELNFVKQKLRESSEKQTFSKKNEDYKTHIKQLEQRFSDLRENSSKVLEQLEEAEYVNEGLKQSHSRLKEELDKLTNELIEERKIKYELEMKTIENKERITELLHQNSSLLDESSTNNEEVF